jgi:predicted nucleotidyltransferase
MMHVEISKLRAEIGALCNTYGVEKLEIFGSGARAADFDASRSDADFLVTFKPAARNDLAAFADFKEALESLLGRTVDLVEREALETSRNFIRRRAILRDAQPVYG